MDIPLGDDTDPHTTKPENLGFNIVTQPTVDQLSHMSTRHEASYRDWKREFVGWLTNKGKEPESHTGYADRTCEQVSHKTDQIMRFLWSHTDGYTTEITPEGADTLMAAVASNDNWGNSSVLMFRKTLKRYFKWKKYVKDIDHDWSCDIRVSETERTNRDYFRKEEFTPLYDATLRYGSVKPYGECSPEERDQFKAVLAQRFELPKEDITRPEFERANSWKIPSLLSVTLDMGLRPIEITRARTEWVNLDGGYFDIPATEATKSDENWDPSLSQTSIGALRRWIDERSAYEKYEDTDTLWLNKIGNPYNSQSLNRILRNLMDTAEIDPMGRDLTWYSIRHGVATLWVNKYGIEHAKHQLRHEKLETTMRYSHSDARDRADMVDGAW